MENENELKTVNELFLQISKREILKMLRDKEEKEKREREEKSEKIYGEAI